MFGKQDQKKKGPLANFGPDMVPSDEDVPMGQMPEGIEEKVLEEEVLEEEVL